MKNRYLILLAGLLVAGSMLLVACGDKNDKPADTKAPTAAQTDPATDPAEESSSTPAEESSSTPAEESSSTPAEESSSTPAEESSSTPAEESSSTPDEESSSTPDEESSSASDESTDDPENTLPYEDWFMCTDFIPHACFDEIKPNSLAGANIKPTDYDKANALTVSNTVSNLYAWGWVAVYGEGYEFGYVIDDGEIITDPAFAVEAPADVLNAASGFVGASASRYAIAIDVAALEGAHNVKAILRLDNLYFVIAEFNIDKEGVTETEPEDDNTEPDNVYNVDLSTLSDQTCYKPNFIAAGYTKPLFALEYGISINLGEMDLSKYSAVRIEYGCDGSAATQANFDALNGDAPIGLKSAEGSYGNSGNYEMDGDIAHGDMVFSSLTWASGARWIEIDLTNVDYAGNVYVAVHNPVGTQIAISAIQFVPAETQPEA